jgi:hypothetical protein
MLPNRDGAWHNITRGMPYLDEIIVPRGARIYTKPELARRKIDQIFDMVAAGLPGGTILERTIRKRMHGGMASLLVFRRTDGVAFLPNHGLTDIKHGYFLLLEKKDLALGLSKYASKVDATLDSHFTRLGFEEVLRLYDQQDTTYEAITMRTLGGAAGLLRRAYEAADLASVMPRAGTSRSSPSRLKLRNKQGRVRLSPSTSYVGEYGGGVQLPELFMFLDRIAGARTKRGGGSTFLDGFAAPLQLCELPTGVVPTHLFFHVQEILDAIEDAEGLLLGSTAAEATKAATDVYDSLKSDVQTACELVLEAGASADQSRPRYALKMADSEVGHVIQGKRKLSLRILRWQELWIAGESGTQRLDRVVADNGMFTVTFSNAEYAYAEGTVFQNKRLPEEAGGLLACLQPIADLSNCTSEKGMLSKKSKNFSHRSVFGVIESLLSGNGALVVCDDLGDEWADHIRLRDGSDPLIEFVHSKWTAGPTSSASAFHDLASQAIKNLGNLATNAKDRIGAKVAKWQKPYANTNIERIRTVVPPAELQKTYESLSNGISTKRVMALAAPFLSKAQFEGALAQLSANGGLPAHVNQQIWILSSFADICRQNGVFPIVYCLP